MTEWLDDFLLRAILAGLIMVVIAAPMGCLMVWQRLAFLSDTLGHAAVMGVALGSRAYARMLHEHGGSG